MLVNDVLRYVFAGLPNITIGQITQDYQDNNQDNNDENKDADDDVVITAWGCHLMLQNCL